MLLLDHRLSSLLIQIKHLSKFFICSSISGGGRLTVSCPNVKNSSKEAAVGRVSELNIWKNVIDEEELRRMSLGCKRRDGDLMTWRSMLSGLLGNAYVRYDTSSCQDLAGL